MCTVITLYTIGKVEKIWLYSYFMQQFCCECTVLFIVIKKYANISHNVNKSVWSTDNSVDMYSVGARF
jgi:hypothetical protein